MHNNQPQHSHSKSYSTLIQKYLRSHLYFGGLVFAALMFGPTQTIRAEDLIEPTETIGETIDDSSLVESNVLSAPEKSPTHPSKKPAKKI